MKIRWLGHSCFLIVAGNGLRIVTDPFHEGDGLAYAPVRETADIVLVSHDHFDHNNISAVSGNPVVVRDSGRRVVKGVNLEGISAWHDTENGRKRGPMVMFIFDVDGLRLCHVGDLGHDLDPGQIGKLGKVDILFVPVGGFYTIDGAGADRLCGLLKPGVVIPMHYLTPLVKMPISAVDAFIRGKSDVRREGASEIELDRENFPTSPEVVVLQPANQLPPS
jgi:L-ascorbate metabolism protein UlaG (beta-lactamase superfamily)